MRFFITSAEWWEIFCSLKSRCDLMCLTPHPGVEVQISPRRVISLRPSTEGLGSVPSRLVFLIIFSVQIVFLILHVGVKLLDILLLKNKVFLHTRYSTEGLRRQICVIRLAWAAESHRSDSTRPRVTWNWEMSPVKRRFHCFRFEK